MTKKFSIIIPYYNGSKYIKETIQSVLKQTYTNYELIIINDSSSDDEYNFLCNCISEINIDCIKVKSNANNLGLLSTLNHGVDISAGEYVIILGQDDMVDSEHLMSLINYIENFNDDFSLIFSDAYYISGNNKTSVKVRGQKLDCFSNDVVNFTSLMKWNYVCSTGVCINKDMLKLSGGFNSTFKNYGEWLTWLKLSKYKPIRINRKVFAWYRRHEDNITNTMFQSEFKKTFDYYNYVNGFAYSLSDRSFLFKAIYINNKVKNCLLLMYKKLFKYSITHKKVK